MSANVPSADVHDAARRKTRSLIIALAVPALVAAAGIVGIGMFIAATPRAKRDVAVVVAAPPVVVKEPPADHVPPKDDVKKAAVEIPILVKPAPLPPPQSDPRPPIQPPPK